MYAQAARLLVKCENRREFLSQSMKGNRHLMGICSSELWLAKSVKSNYIRGQSVHGRHRIDIDYPLSTQTCMFDMTDRCLHEIVVSSIKFKTLKRPRIFIRVWVFRAIYTARSLGFPNPFIRSFHQPVTKVQLSSATQQILKHWRFTHTRLIQFGIQPLETHSSNSNSLKWTVFVNIFSGKKQSLKHHTETRIGLSKLCSDIDRVETRIGLYWVQNQFTDALL